MTRSTLRDTVNSLIKSGKLSLDNSSGLVHIMGPAPTTDAGHGSGQQLTMRPSTPSRCSVPALKARSLETMTKTQQCTRAPWRRCKPPRHSGRRSKHLRTAGLTPAVLVPPAAAVLVTSTRTRSCSTSRGCSADHARRYHQAMNSPTSMRLTTSIFMAPSCRPVRRGRLSGDERVGAGCGVLRAGS